MYWGWGGAVMFPLNMFKKNWVDNDNSWMSHIRNMSFQI